MLATEPTTVRLPANVEAIATSIHSYRPDTQCWTTRTYGTFETRFDIATVNRVSPPPDRPKSGNFVMPNLGLRQAEIAALVAFLNADRKAAY